jgi:hypothetical protein
VDGWYLGNFGGAFRCIGFDNGKFDFWGTPSDCRPEQLTQWTELPPLPKDLKLTNNHKPHITMTIQGKPVPNPANNVYTGGIKPKQSTFKSTLIEAGIHPKNADSAKNLLFALAIGGFGLLLALVIELF